MEILQNKTAVITGAASGIGLGITRALIAEGVHVAMLDVESAALEVAAANLGSTNVDVQRFVVDVSDREQMQDVAGVIGSHFGKVHILCNNAGVATGGAIDELDYSLWDWCLGVNLNGVINGMQTFLPLMTEHGEGGHLVNTSSILGLVSIPGQASYSASKFAVVGICEAARKDLEPKNIGVSVLCPGLIATNIVKSGRNRPAGLGGGAPLPSVLDEIDNMYKTDGLSADIVGEQVVHGIKTNKPYIFTHADLAAGLKARFQKILACFDGTEAGTIDANTVLGKDV